MGNATQEMVRNGCEVVTRADVIDTTHLAMSEMDKARLVLASIARLTATGDEVLAGLAEHASELLAYAHNELDVLHERADKAGIMGDMVPEGKIHAVGC